jgi:hypothetical protein
MKPEEIFRLQKREATVVYWPQRFLLKEGESNCASWIDLDFS